MPYHTSPGELSRIIETQKTPFYIYNRKILEQTISGLKAAFPIPGFQLLFATMANDNNDFLKIVCKNNVGACINSIRHLDKVLECGFSKDKIQYTSTGIGEEDLNTLFKEGVTVNFDSLGQLRQWFRLKKHNKAGLRINTASLSEKNQFPDRLGIEKEQVKEALGIASSENGIINGLHIYAGTNYKNHLDMLPAFNAFFELAKEVATLEYLNIGGGIGVNYLNEEDHFDIQEYGKYICELVLKLRQFHNKDIKLVFEPGRRLAAESGALITKVTDVKTLRSTKYIVVDASIAVFPRPFHHPESPHTTLCPFKETSYGVEKATVVGKTTFSKDILVTADLPKNIEVGDILLFEQAGAYCDSMRSRFLGQNEPGNIIVNE